MNLAKRAGRILDILAPHGLVLIYHQVGRAAPDPLHLSLPLELFTAQMEELRRGWNPISLDNLMKGLSGGTLPEKSVAVTFDDGYATVLSQALPVLERLAIPATVFVSTGSAGEKKEFWWDELQRIVWEGGNEPAGWSGLAGEIRMRLSPGMRPEDAFLILHDGLRTLAPAALAGEMDKYRRWSGIRSAAPRGDVRPLSRPEYRRLAAARFVSIGAHTVNHPWMATLAEKEQAAEMETSRRKLEEDLGQPVRAFAYPFGGRDSETAATLRLARAAGFEYACANVKAAVHGGSDRYWIPRLTPGDAAGAGFSRRLAEYLESPRSPRTPKGYAGTEIEIRGGSKRRVVWTRLPLILRRIFQWIGYRWIMLTAPKTKRRKLRIPVLTAMWARFRLTAGLAPLSVLSGNDRGLPLNRYYIEKFFVEFGSDVRGRVLEFQNDQYASRIGKAAVGRLDILHKEGSGQSRQATIVADLTRPNNIPAGYYDCIICTHVLHIIADLPGMLKEMRRILSPGGVLLVAVPLVDTIEPWWHELWRFTPEGLGSLMEDAFGKENVQVRAYGNSLTAAASMRGLTAEEFTRRELDALDERFAVEVCARAIKRQ
jgi:peptidoglycan/xylan/chitin deacetylase (PgdA/CDA1 family)